MRIRKQDYELTILDLQEYPVWQYALDEEGLPGQDEKTVRPYLELPPHELQGNYIIIRAIFTFADGTRMIGIIKPISVTPSPLMKTLIPADLSPTIITEAGRIPFWFGAQKPKKAELAKYFRLLNKSPAEVFPIEFASDVEVNSAITSGTIQGFLFCDRGLDPFQMTAADILVKR